MLYLSNKLIFREKGIAEDKELTYLSFFHLFQSERSFFRISGDLDKFYSAEAADTEGGDDAHVTQLQGLELLVDAKNISKVFFIIQSHV